MKSLHRFSDPFLAHKYFFVSQWPIFDVKKGEIPVLVESALAYLHWPNIWVPLESVLKDFYDDGVKEMLFRYSHGKIPIMLFPCNLLFDMACSLTKGWN